VASPSPVQVNPSTTIGPTDVAAAGEPYAAFISYRHAAADRRWAEWLHSSLETYRVPAPLVKAGVRRRLGRVFRDEEELAASPDLSASIQTALRRASCLIVVCSPRTPASQWVEAEVRRFQEMGRGPKVLALLIEGEPGTTFPLALRSEEPLAADVRPSPGQSARALKRTALLKLLAGMLDVPYDALRQREEERARRRLIAVTTTSVAAAFVFLGLSAFAFQQWRRAEAELKFSRAQNLAVQAQVATAAAGDPENPVAPDADRGVLLALESLRTLPTVEGDRALRAGLQKLGRPAMEASIGDADTLTGVGPQGAWIALETLGGARILDLATGTTRDAVRAEREETGAIAAASDQGVDVLSRDGLLRVRESTEGAGGWIFGSAEITRSRDGRRIALLPHEWALRFAAFSPDSQRLATVTGQAGADAQDPSATALVGSTVRIWNIASGEKLSEVSFAHRRGIDGLALSADGNWLALAVSAPGKAVLVWPLWPELVLADACRRLSRNLSPSEWLTFVRVGPHRATCPELPIVSE
jgi:TIR domain